MFATQTNTNRPLSRFRSPCRENDGLSRKTITAMTVLLLPLLLIAVCGCPMSAPGVTTGGQQDVASARQTILDGGVPDPDSITVEGFLSEHSIEITPPADAELLYAVATTAWNDDFEAFTPLATLQLGLGTTVERDDLQRPDLNLCLVIDRSGSMADPVDGRSDTSKLDAVLIAVDRLLARLTPNDLVSVVVFDTGTNRIVRGAAGDDLATIKGALEDITPEGGTDLARGLNRGFTTVREFQTETRSDRVIVFTDALLTRQADASVQAFIDTMKSFASQGIGATTFGIGSRFGDEVAFDISQVRGGNYFFLSDYDRIVNVFDEEFEFLVTPIAYDVALTVTVPFEFDVAGVYGIQVDEPFPHTLELTIPTLFLSSREGGGAILIRIRPGAQVDFAVENLLATIDMTYETPEGESVTHPQVTARLPADLDSAASPPYFETVGTQRGVLLLNTALAIKSVSEDLNPYQGRINVSSATREQAVTRLTDFLSYFDTLAEGLPDQPSETSRSLSEERALVAQLRTNIDAG